MSNSAGGKAHICSQTPVESCREGKAQISLLPYTSQQDFGTRKVYCVSNVTFHAESKYTIKIFPSPTVFCTMAFSIIDFSEFWVFSSVIFYT